MTDKQNLAQSLEGLSEIYEQIQSINHEREEQLWNSLSSEQQLDVFCAVVRRIYQGELEDKGTYRYVLYQVFQFGLDSYSRGMDCGYLTLHNSIYTEDYEQKLLTRFAEMMFNVSEDQSKDLVTKFLSGAVVIK